MLSRACDVRLSLLWEDEPPAEQKILRPPPPVETGEQFLGVTLGTQQ